MLIRNDVVSGSRDHICARASIIAVPRQNSDVLQEVIFCGHFGRKKERKVQNRDGAAVRGIRPAPTILCNDASTISGPRCPQTAPASRCPRPMSAGTPPYGDGARNGRPMTPWTMARVHARARDRGSRRLGTSLRNLGAQLQKLSELEHFYGGTSIIGF